MESSQTEIVDEVFVNSLQYKKQRLAFINIVKHKFKNELWQKYFTPSSIVNQIIDMSVSSEDIETKKFTVFFNLEFLEELIYTYNVPRKNITFFADHSYVKIVGDLLYQVKSYYIDEDSYIDVLRIMNMKLGNVLTNPPYNNYIDLDIIDTIYDYSDQIVAIHPAPYLMKHYFDDKNDESCRLKKFCKKYEGKVKSIEFFDPNNTFGINNPTPVVIIHIDKKYDGDCKVSFTQDSFFNLPSEPYKIQSLTDISYFGPDNYKNLVLPFYEKIKNHITINGSVASNIVQNANTLDSNCFHCFLPNIQGNTNTAKNFKSFHRSDFFAFIPKSGFTPKKNDDGTYDAEQKNNLQFNTQIERDNFVDYLKTDFARFCLALHKFNKNLGPYLFMVPWMDFTQSWNDEKLFEHFNISDEMKELILDFIPDFH